MGSGSRRRANPNPESRVCAHIAWWISAEGDLAQGISLDREKGRMRCECYNKFDRIFRAHSRSFQRPSEVGEWLSLVEHLVRDQGVGGSNPLSPTINPKQLIGLARTPFLWISTFGSVWVQLANLPPSEPLLSLPLAMREYTFLV